MSTAVSVNNLSFGYGRDPVLTDVSFDLPLNSFLVIIGPNGGGKSTLLRLLLGLLPIQSGSISIFGKPVEKALHDTGYVPQDTQQIKNFPINVLDTVKMSLYRPGLNLTKAEVSSRAYEALSVMGVKDIAGERVNAISGGQRQRVLIARAIAQKPRLLIMDEPISAVDPAGQISVLTVLESLLKDTTIVFVSHDLSVIPGHATAVACVNRTLFYHPSGEITPSVVSHAYGELASLALVSHQCGCGEHHE